MEGIECILVERRQRRDQSRLKNIIGIGVGVLGKARHTSSIPVMRSKDQIFERSGFLGTTSRSFAEVVRGLSSPIFSQSVSSNLCPFIQGVCGEPDFLSSKQLIRLKVGKRLFLCRILDNEGDVSEDGKVLDKDKGKIELPKLYTVALFLNM
ncbi:hypothetical protein Dimus_022910 [Dionaea muscipula]